MTIVAPEDDLGCPRHSSADYALKEITRGKKREQRYTHKPAQTGVLFNGCLFYCHVCCIS